MTDNTTTIFDFIKQIIYALTDIFVSVGMPTNNAKLISTVLISILVLGILFIPIQYTTKLLHKLKR